MLKKKIKKENGSAKPNRLKAIREKLGLSPLQMAKKIKISISYYYNTENGRIPISKNISKVLDKITEKLKEK